MNTILCYILEFIVCAILIRIAYEDMVKMFDDSET